MKIILILYTIIIVLLAILPINNGNGFLNDNFILSFRLDYIAHFAIFIPWMLISWLFYASWESRTLLRIFGWILLGLILAVATEFVQYLLPYRAFNINDLAANVLGVMLGGLFFIFKPKRKKEPEL
ncbi:MAG TPA: VanZ family protein [Bacteroidales bacterium]|nr:VanZ family protein [Bacteroidales bacterium]HPI85109.1 VanZ family protein [Bacteroidales bacterium]HPM91723.1 VanZ family protein [Bacteroidales bacterium]